MLKMTLGRREMSLMSFAVLRRSVLMCSPGLFGISDGIQSIRKRPANPANQS